jgi:hypothetical protein
MAEVNQSLGCVVGDDYDFKISMQPGDDLTGAQVEWVLTEGLFYGAKTLLTKIPGNVALNTSVTPNLWEIFISLTPTDTRSLRPAVLYHQAKVKLGNGKIRTIEGGLFNLRPSADALGTLLT